METVRIIREARAVRSLPTDEKRARERSIKMMMNLPREERMRLYKRVHAAKRTVTDRITASLVALPMATGTALSQTRPQTPRDVEEYIDVHGRRILAEATTTSNLIFFFSPSQPLTLLKLSQVIETERLEEALVRALRFKASESAQHGPSGPNNSSMSSNLHKTALLNVLRATHGVTNLKPSK